MHRLRRNRVAFVFFGLVFSLVALPAIVRGADALRLSLDEKAAVRGLAVGRVDLPVHAAPLVSLCDMATAQWSAPTRCDGQPPTGLTLRFAEARATVALTARSEDGALRFAGHLQGDDLPARGMLLRVAFPLDAVGWQWHADIASAAAIEAGKRYENVVSLRAWADLPEWRDQPELRMGYSNRNFATVITGPVGLCLAVPIDRPCLFRTAYDAVAKRLEIVYDLALSPDSRTPNRFEFAFDLFACDPRWGFRDALARYYALYPKLFERLVDAPGQWMAFSRLSEIDNVNEFYFGLQEGAPETDYDDRLGVLSTSYFTHAGMGANLPDHDPEKDPLPPHDVQVAAMEKAFKTRTGIEGLFAQVGLHNAQGQLDIRKWSAYAHLISQFNLDPELPYGAWTLQRAQAMLAKKGVTGRAGLDGFYYDGLPTGLNYNVRHFRTADAPCLWDPVAKKPFLNNFFSSCEFARAAAEMLRPQDRITMMNGAMGASFYVAPWLDVLGAETGLTISRPHLNYIRTITWQKPFLTLLKGNYEKQLGHAQIEQYMKRCLACGIVPGFFDWPTSGLGPGGRYWDHPRYFERDRDLFRRYLPLCCELARVGWQPVPHARCDTEAVFVERFGPADGVVWLTLSSDRKEPCTTTLSIDASPLGLDLAKVHAVEAISGEPVALSVKDGKLSAQIALPAGDMAVLQLGTPEALCRWRVGQAKATLQRGITMRELDAERPPLAVHWRPGQGARYDRRQVDGRWELVFRGSPRIAQRAEQWAMLFQTEPSEVVLRVRASAEDLVARAEAVGIACRVAWVSKSFSHYENRFFALPSGTYADRDFEFRIQVPHALRAIHLAPTVAKGVQGTLRLSRVSLRDAQRDEYVADPEFSAWYEPLPAELRGPVEEQCQAIAAALEEVDAKTAAGGALLGQAIDAALARCETLRQTIRSAQADNGGRRVLRDVETIARHLNLARKAGNINPEVPGTN